MIDPVIQQAIESISQSGRFVVAVMSANDDAIQITEQHTAGINLAVGCAALVKSVLGPLDPIAERKFLEEFVTELRKPKHAPI